MQRHRISSIYNQVTHILDCNSYRKFCLFCVIGTIIAFVYITNLSTTISDSIWGIRETLKQIEVRLDIIESIKTKEQEPPSEAAIDDVRLRDDSRQLIQQMTVSRERGMPTLAPPLNHSLPNVVPTPIPSAVPHESSQQPHLKTPSPRFK